MGLINRFASRVALLLVGVFSVGTLSAQTSPGASPSDPAPYEFEHLTYRDGLANSSVSAILQDGDGFLWFASQAGLHRYDGYTMDLFGAVPFEENSLSNQLVQTIHHDRDAGDHTLWVGTYSGLNRLDLITEEITRYPADPDIPTALSHNIVTAIREDADGTVWVGTLAGLNRLDDEETGVFSRWLPDPDDPGALPHETVRAVFRDSRGTLWVGTYGGLSEVVTGDATTGGAGEPVPVDAVRFRTYRADPGDPAAGPPDDRVMAIAGDADGAIWIGAWGGGLARFDPEAERFEHFELPDQRVYSVLVASDGRVYAGTWGGGLHVLDPATGEITSYRHDPDDSHSLAHDVVYSLYEDDGGIICIGTNGNGVNLLDPRRHSFRYLHRELPEERRIDSGKVTALAFDHRNRDVYVGLQTNGLNVVDAETGRVRRYRYDPADPGGIGSDRITFVLAEADGTALVGTEAGLFRFDPATEVFSELYRSDDPHRGITDGVVYSGTVDAMGRYWFGTFSQGLFRRNRDGSFSNFRHDDDDERSLAHDLVFRILPEPDGTVWVATNGGLSRYRPETDDFDRFVHDPDDRSGLSSNDTNIVIRDSTGALWVGTRSGGLNRFDEETGTFTHITTSNGLSSNQVVAIAELRPGTLYVATSNGLNRVDTATGEVTIVDERDGLNVREFSTGVTRDPDGNLLFGAFSEVIRVQPQRDQGHRTPPRTVITGIRVNNEPLIVDRAYHTVDRVELDYRSNFIGFSFAALDYSISERNRFRYRLVGIDPEWRDGGTDPSTDYTNLPPGTYRFEVLGADARGTWSTRPAVVTVNIEPPYWDTGWFRIGIVLLAVAVIVGAYYLRVGSIRRHNRVLEETVATRTGELRDTNRRLAEANEVKNRFFSILAHDLRGPVHGIASLSANVLDDPEREIEKELREYLEAIGTASQGVASMLDNLLEWARIQSDTIRVEAKEHPLSRLVTTVAAAFYGAAQVKGIAMRVECDTDAVVFVDDHMTRSIIQNVIGNAVKFTPSGGTIEISCGTDGDDVSVSVRDTGVGIPPEKKDEIFVVGNAGGTTGTAGEKGSGMGLPLSRELAERQGGRVEISSEVGGGTTVVVTLPRKA